ncbi:MAG: FAD-binding protein, partial [Flavobacteriales bacterium]|nr:FAD-binding protein [Flavobacteriales bacterium]
METVQFSVLPEQAVDNAFLKQKITKELNISDFDFKIVKRSIDARRKPVTINLKIDVYIDGESNPQTLTEKKYQNVSSGKPVIIVGFGPAGMFATLKLIELGYKPIVLERGKDVRSRRRDLAAINKEHIVNPESNYCFGEGGAGTFSDGKLYT